MDETTPYVAAAPERTVRRLQDLLATGAFPPGSRLPGERALAARLVVSRAALREALATLEALGVLRTEPRRGTTVTGAPAAVAGWLFGNRSSAADFFQFRFVTEGYAARLAAQRARGDDVASLRANLVAMRDALRTRDLVAVADLDGLFHETVMRISGNRIFLDLHAQYGAMTRQSQALPLANLGRLVEPVSEHENVVRAIERQDPDGAAYFMHLHILRAADRSGIALDDVA